MTKLIHKNLTYKIRGIIFDAHNDLGRYRNEKQYADYLENRFIKDNINYVREYIIPKSFPGEKRGRNRVDFLVEEKIFLELKTVYSFNKNHFKQCLRYLESSNVDLLLLVNFKKNSCIIKRVLSPKLLEAYP